MCLGVTNYTIHVDRMKKMMGDRFFHKLKGIKDYDLLVRVFDQITQYTAPEVFEVRLEDARSAELLSEFDGEQLALCLTSDNSWIRQLAEMELERRDGLR